MFNSMNKYSTVLLTTYKNCDYGIAVTKALETFSLLVILLGQTSVSVCVTNNNTNVLLWHSLH